MLTNTSTTIKFAKEKEKSLLPFKRKIRLSIFNDTFCLKKICIEHFPLRHFTGDTAGSTMPEVVPRACAVQVPAQNAGGADGIFSHL